MRWPAVVAVILAIAGCLQKPDRPGETDAAATVDAIVPPPDDASGIDATTIDATTSDAAPSCGTCYGVGTPDGESLACVPGPDYCSGVADYVEQTDLCSCGAPEPRVFVYRTPQPRVNVAILAISGPTEDYLKVDGSCRRGTYFCGTAVNCGTDTRTVVVWESIPIVADQMQFATYSDDACTVGPHRSILANL